MSNAFRKVRKEIIRWYILNGRSFPWRLTKTPYRTMIAEFMLHRTKAEQVVPVYNEFIREYPDVFTLAKAEYKDVKEITSHLGLHWRSRHFTESARFVVKNFGGIFPENYSELRKIPGVGEYIAGAIMVVSFNKPAPAVDSNIARLINRVWDLNLTGEIRRKKEIKQIAQKLFNCENPGDLLFALIDFTTAICTPRNPKCDECPYQHLKK